MRVIVVGRKQLLQYSLEYWKEENKMVKGNRALFSSCNSC